MIEEILEKQINRWYKLIDHPVQLALVAAVSEGIRFPVIPAGRRSGKTERFKRFVVKQAMRNSGEMFFVAAPTHAQVKQIYWEDLKMLTLSITHKKRPSESELKIFMPNGSQIHLIGLDKPERIEGINWTGGGIDEIANIKATAWESNILPALNTVNPTRPDFRAWCWLLGVPEKLDHYYGLAEYARTANDPDWGYFHWKSAEILPPDVIASAKRQMSAKQFRIEYEASFEGTTGLIYDDYCDENYTDSVIQSHEQLYWYHDFNYTPMSSGVGVRRGDEMYLLDEIILKSAVARESSLEFVEKYKDHDNKNVMVFGDPSGKAGEKHGHSSDYTEIERVLKDSGWKYTRKVKPSTRSIKNGQNAVRRKIKNAAGEVSLYVNIKKAPYTHKSLQQGQLKKGSTFIEEENEYQHIGTAVRYLIDWEFPIMSETATVESMW